jgi:hypothetical protein
MMIRNAVAAIAVMSVTGACSGALQITPPHLAPDAQGIVATEVKSSLGRPSRWSVRVVPWEPGQPDQSAPSLMPVSAATESAAPHPIAVDISPRFFTLIASGRQVIRARVHDRSRRYRLLIEQIPSDDALDTGINFRFRFSLPVYHSGKDPLIPLRETRP